MNAIKLRLVDDWRCCWRWLSVQLHALALLWVALYAIAPTLPPELSGAIPSPYQAKVIAAYSFLGILFRLIAQKSATQGNG